MIHWTPLLVALPLGAAFVTPLAARLHRRLPDLLGCLTLAGLLALSLGLLGHTGSYEMGGWPRPIGIELRIDDLTTLLLLTINSLALMVGLYSVTYLQTFTGHYKYYSLLLFTVAGANGVVVAGDLFNLYVFMEIATIASYSLVAFGGADEDLEASFKYVVFGSVASSLILIGIALTYGMTGTLNMAHLAERLRESNSAPPLRFALALLVAGLSVKTALVPFHTWLPDAYPAAPAPISALLSGVVSKIAGLYVLARLLFNVFGVAGDPEVLQLLRWMGGVTMVVGGLLALGQWDLKRLLAYSSIGQVGLIVLALGFGTSWAVVGALYHLANHAAFKGLLFLNSGQLEAAAGTRDLRRMHAGGGRLPVTQATCLVGSLSMAGIPPFGGFWSKLIIVAAGVEAGFAGWVVLVVVMSIVTLAYQLKVQKEAFYSADAAEPQRAERETDRWREPVFMATPVILLAVACAALALLTLSGLQRPLLVGPAAEVLMQGTGAW